MGRRAGLQQSGTFDADAVAPHVEIAPIDNKWGLASPTSVAAFGQRLDKHMVIIGLSMAPPKAFGPGGPGRCRDRSGQIGVAKKCADTDRTRRARRRPSGQN
jgi:hypothetical protein